MIIAMGMTYALPMDYSGTDFSKDPPFKYVVMVVVVVVVVVDSC